VVARFLHTADWQIGRQYGQFSADDGPFLVEERFRAVEHIAALAAEQAVDAVLVAGDVFDTQTVEERTIRRLFNAMRGFDGLWLLIPGNHDAALAESVWQRAQRLQVIPSNIHVFLQPGVHAFPERGFAVLAAPLTQRHTYTDLTEFFDTAETAAGLLRIGLAHGCVQGILVEDIDSANPIATDRASRARLDYLALGDWHGCKPIDARTWYSGTPEPDRFKSNDSGQVLLIEIDHPGSEPRVTAHATGNYAWQQWESDLQLASDLDPLIERLMAVTDRDVIRLTLRGQLDLAGRARLDTAIGQAQAHARSLTVALADLRLQPTEEDLAALHADGYLGDVIGELRDLQAGAQAEAASDALAILAGLLQAHTAQGEPA
jgi:DNA repair exonuclease SbcCD nuclease subunit